MLFSRLCYRGLFTGDYLVCYNYTHCAKNGPYYFMNNLIMNWFWNFKPGFIFVHVTSKKNNCLFLLLWQLKVFIFIKACFLNNFVSVECDSIWHDYRQHAQKICEVWTCGFWDNQVERQTCWSQYFMPLPGAQY